MHQNCYRVIWLDQSSQVWLDSSLVSSSTFIFLQSEVGMLKVQESADLVSWHDLPPWLLEGCLLPLCILELSLSVAGWVGTEKERGLSFSFLIKHSPSEWGLYLYDNISTFFLFPKDPISRCKLIRKKSFNLWSFGGSKVSVCRWLAITMLILLVTWLPAQCFNCNKHLWSTLYLTVC